MLIRIATLDDVAAISALLREFFAYNAGQQPDIYVAAVDDGNYPRTVIRSAGGDCIVAETAAGAIVGLAHVEEDATPPYPSVKPHRYACIVDLIVSAQYRKQNIGHLLLEAVKDWARARGLAYIELMVLENNHAGQRFYTREDFVTVSRTMRLSIS